MPLPLRRLWPLCVAATLTACPAPSRGLLAPPPAVEGVIGAANSGLAVRAGSVFGTVAVPVVAAGGGNVVAAGGGNVVAAGGGNVVAAGGGNLLGPAGANYRALQAGAVDELAELPVKGATVLLRDARTLRVLSFVPPTQTDEQGRFSFPVLPAGINFFIEVVGVGQDGRVFRMTSLGRSQPGKARAPMDVTQASTLVAAKVLEEAKGPDGTGKIYVLSPERITGLTRAVAASLQAAPAAERKQAAATLALRVKDGDAREVQLPEQYEQQAFGEASRRLAAIAERDQAVRAQVGEVAQALAAPLSQEEEKVVHLASRVAVAKQIALNGQDEVVVEPSAAPSKAPSAAPASVAPSAPAAGTLLATITLPDWFLPHDMAPDGAGGMWVLDRLGKLSHLGADGAVLASFSPGQSPAGLAVDAAGNAWVTRIPASSVYQFSPTGQELARHGVQSGDHRVRIDAAGTVWVTNYDSDTVTRITSAGTVSHHPAGDGPLDLGFDGAGNAWVVAHAAGQVVKLGPDGSQLGAYAVGTAPEAIALDAAGSAWVAMGGNDRVTGSLIASQAVARLSPAGATLPALTVGESPRSVVRDGKGNLWVGNFTGQSVTQLGADGTVIGTYPVEGNVTSVAVDSAGNVWAAAMAAKKVFKLAP